MSRAPASSPAGRTYLAGDIYSFRTSPATLFSPKKTNRFAVFKVLGLKDECVCVGVLDGVFDVHPSLRDVQDLPIIRSRRFKFKGEPAVCFVPLQYELLLEDVRHLGSRDGSAEEGELLALCRSYCVWLWLNSIAEGEWRWRHDREAYEDEFRLLKEARLARMVEEDKRRKTRLRTLTWDDLLAERPFTGWDRSPQFPPAEFVAASRERIHLTVRLLKELGPQPEKGKVRAILKDCVEWFNGKNAELGGVIETDEREDLCAALEEIAALARQKNLALEIDEWRNW